MRKINTKNSLTDKVFNTEEENNTIFFEIKKNTDFYGLLLSNGFGDEIIKENLWRCKKFFDDYKRWTEYKTFSDCLKANEFQGYFLTFDGNSINRVIYDLPPVLDYRKYDSSFLYRDFDQKFMDLSLNDLDETKNKIKTQVKKELRNNHWIYLTGAIRSGRTYFSIALINGSSRKGVKNIAFFNCVKRLPLLGDEFFNNKLVFQKDFDSLKTVPILVLDDIGNENGNTIIRDSVLIPLLDYRAKEGLMTYFTSDFTVDELVSLYSKGNKPVDTVRVKQLSNILHSKISEELVISKTSIY